MPLNVHTGPTTDPLRIVITGGPGIGKTTLAASIPGAVFLDAEGGGSDLSIARIPIRTWGDATAAVAGLLAEPHPYRVVVIDTVDMLERLCWAQLCIDGGVESIEQYDRGYGKGYTAAVERQQRLIASLDALRSKRHMAIVVLAHTTIKKFDDPEGLPYDRYQLSMNDKAAKLWTGWADAVLFAGLDVRVDETAKGRGKARDEKPARMLWTEARPAYDAKNRHGLPAALPLSWAALSKAIRWDERHPVPDAPAAPRPAVPVPAITAATIATAAGEAMASRGWGRADVVELLMQHGSADGKPSQIPPEHRQMVLDALALPFTVHPES